MAAVLKPGSSHIKFNAFPKVSLPTVKVGTGKAQFECSSIEATGSVTLTGSQPAAGWALGFIQVEWVDTNWLYYRGRQNNHGSIFFQRSRPPTRPIKACRDVDPETDIYYTDDPATVTLADTFPKTLTVDHEDKPVDVVKAVVTNSLTGEDNFIREAQLEFLFCTVLSARDPAGDFHHLKSFYWNVRWQSRFLPHDFANPLGAWFVTPIAAGQGSARSHVIEGNPTDKRFKDILTDTSVRGCNAIIPLYKPPPDGVLPVGHPCRRESKVWQNFDVRL
jgi:hypothetical protein